MKNVTSYNDFTGLFSLAKTLRFELKPIGKTLEHIEQKGLLDTDEKRAFNYQKVKKLIDEYHRDFITQALSGKQLSLTLLKRYYELYQIQNRSDDESQEIDTIEKNLRKEIADVFTKHPKYKSLFAKELIKSDLPAFLSKSDEKDLVHEFDNFTTYFKGFHENRKNMYSTEEKSTAIAYRLIHQNLPKFVDNMRTFEKVKASPVAEHFKYLLSNDQLGGRVPIKSIEEMFTISYFNNTLTQQGIDTYNLILGGYTDEEGTKKIQGLNEYINLYNQKAEKHERIGKLKPLFKQILSDRSSASFIPEQYESDNEVLESVESFYREIYRPIQDRIKHLFDDFKSFDLTTIYIKNDTGLTDVSQKMFGDWGLIHKSIEAEYERKNAPSKNEKPEKYEERKIKYVKSQPSFPIGLLNSCIKHYLDNGGATTSRHWMIIINR